MVSIASHDDRLPISTIEQMLTDFWSVSCFRNQDGNTDKDAIKQLDGYDDHNYRIRSQNNQLFILKITNKAESTRTSLIEAQNQMMLHFDARISDKSVPVPVEVWGEISNEIINGLESPNYMTNFVFEPQPPKQKYPESPASCSAVNFYRTHKLPYRVSKWNRYYVQLDFGDKDVRVVRLFYYVKGIPMGSTKVFTTEYSNRFFIELGSFLARVVQESKKLPMRPFLQVNSLWKLENAVLLTKILCSNQDILDQNSYISYNQIMWVCKEFNESVLIKLYTKLERQVIHGDLNEDNILVERNVRQDDELNYFTYPVDMSEPHSVDYNVTGFIDFADAHVGCALFEIAIALTYILISSEDFNALSAALFGYRMQILFHNLELDVLKICIEARLCQSIVLSLLKLKQMGVTSTKNSTDPIVNYIGGKNELKWRLLTKLRHMTNKQFLFEIAQKGSQMAITEPPLDTTRFLNIQFPPAFQPHVPYRFRYQNMSPSMFTYRTKAISADSLIAQPANVNIYLPVWGEREKELERKREFERECKRLWEKERLPVYEAYFDPLESYENLPKSKVQLPEFQKPLEPSYKPSSKPPPPKLTLPSIERANAEAEKALISSTAQKIVKIILKFMYPDRDDVFQEEIVDKPTFNYVAPIMENPPKGLPEAYKNKALFFYPPKLINEPINGDVSKKTRTAPKPDPVYCQLKHSFYTRIPPPPRPARIQINFNRLKSPKPVAIASTSTTELELPRCETPIFTVKNFEDNPPASTRSQPEQQEETSNSSPPVETVERCVSPASQAIDSSTNNIESVNGIQKSVSSSSITASQSSSLINGSHISEPLEPSQSQSCSDIKTSSTSDPAYNPSFNDTARTRPLERPQSFSMISQDSPTNSCYLPIFTTAAITTTTASTQPSSTLVTTPKSPKIETPFESPLSTSSIKITSPVKTVMVKMSLQRDLFINTEKLEIAAESCSMSAEVTPISDELPPLQSPSQIQSTCCYLSEIPDTRSSTQEVTSVSDRSTVVTAPVTTQASSTSSKLATCEQSTTSVGSLTTSSETKSVTQSFSGSSIPVTLGEKTTCIASPTSDPFSEAPSDSIQSSIKITAQSADSVSVPEEKSLSHNNSPASKLTSGKFLMQSTKSNIPKITSTSSFSTRSKTETLSKSSFENTSSSNLILSSSLNKSTPSVSSLASGSKQAASPTSRLPIRTKTAVKSPATSSNASKSTPITHTSHNNEKSTETLATKPITINMTSKMSEASIVSQPSSATVGIKSSPNETATNNLSSACHSATPTTCATPMTKVQPTKVQIPSADSSSMTTLSSTAKKRTSKWKRKPRKK